MFCKIKTKGEYVMQISSRFTIAAVILLAVYFKKIKNINKSELKHGIIMGEALFGGYYLQVLGILSSLKKSHLLNVQRGTGGTTIAKPLDQITLFDIYQSVECVENGELFHFHENPNNNCPVGKNIHNILDNKLMRVQKAMEDELSSITLKDVIEDTRFYVQQEMK